jgi:hypothetical protein
MGGIPPGGMPPPGPFPPPGPMPYGYGTLLVAAFLSVVTFIAKQLEFLLCRIASAFAICWQHTFKNNYDYLTAYGDFNFCDFSFRLCFDFLFGFFFLANTF